MYKIPFSGRAHFFDEAEIKAVTDVMQSGNTLTQGAELKKFEQKFSDYIGTPYCFAVHCATGALELAAQLCQFDKGEEVIVPSHTFTATVYPFVKQGASVKWADIDPNTRVVSAESIAKCITPKTKAIIVVHLYGFCADMPAIQKLADERGIFLIEDTAQAIGAELDGKKAGTFGDFGIFSFHSHKNVTTLGEGGILTVKDQEIASLIPMLRHNGHCAFTYEREAYWKPAMGNVDLPTLNGKVLWPNNFCITEVQCAVGSKLLDKVDTYNNFRRQRAKHFIQSLSDYPELEFHADFSEQHIYHLLVASCSLQIRDRFIQKMADDFGIQCVVQYYPLNRYDFYQKLGFAEADCPNADAFFDSMVSFPFQQWMSDEDFDYMLNSVKKVLDYLR